MAKKGKWGFRKVNVPFVIFVYILFMATGYYLAAGAEPEGTIFTWYENMQLVFEEPLRWYWNQYTIPCMSLTLLCYLFWFLYYLASARNYMKGREYGTARYATPAEITKKLADLNNSPNDVHNIVVERQRLFRKPKRLVVNTRNRILSQHIQMTLDTRHTDLNNNILIIGGSGSAKTFREAKPILMQMSSSFIVTDPKGELTRDTAGLLKKYGYTIKVLNVLNAKEMKTSSRYNPFRYITSDIDIVKLVDIFMNATKKKGAAASEQIWDDLTAILLQAIFFYVHDKGVEIDGRIHHDFKAVMELVNLLKLEEDPSTGQRMRTKIDVMFEQLEKENPSHQAVLNYNKIMVGATDTIRSVISTLNARTTCLQTPEILDLLSDDEIDIASIGARKTVVYCKISDHDKTYRFVVSFLYQQMIQQLYDLADTMYGGKLPVHVAFLMDEFANVSLPDDYSSWLSTMRGRGMSSIIIIQNMAQLKVMFKDIWETVPGNCDTVIYLGGNEQSTHEYINKLLGTGTIDKKTHGLTRGRNESASANEDVIGRALMLPDEVRKMSRKKCLVIITGYDPVIDDKTNTFKHPLWNEMNRLAAKYRFDARLERLGTGSIALRAEDNEEDATMVTLVDKTKVDILRAEDERNKAEYAYEKQVAQLAGELLPEEPPRKVMDVTLAELIIMAEEHNLLDDEMLKQAEELLPEMSLGKMDEAIEEILLQEYAADVEGSSQYFEMVETEEAESSENTKKAKKSIDFKKAEIAVHAFKDLLAYGYTPEQLRVIYPLTNKYTPKQLYDMFAPDMDVQTMALMIDLLSES